MKEIRLKNLRPNDSFEHLGQKYFVLDNKKGRIIAISATGQCRLCLEYDKEKKEDENRQLELDHVSEYGYKKAQPSEVSQIMGKMMLGAKMIKVRRDLSPEIWNHVDLQLRCRGYRLTGREGEAYKYELKE